MIVFLTNTGFVRRWPCSILTSVDEDVSGRPPVKQGQVHQYSFLVKNTVGFRFSYQRQSHTHRFSPFLPCGATALHW